MNLSFKNILMILAIFMTVTGLAGERKPHGGMLRFPDVSRTHIVFLYANNLWVVAREGGMASPLSSPTGIEGFPRFSPDGETIVFMGNYDGDNELYKIPLGGGVPLRLTYHPGNELLSDWMPDGKSVLFSVAGRDFTRAPQIWRIGADGGLAEKLPVPYGGNGAVSADGVWLAYTPLVRDTATWKRYRGGMAADIWLFNLKTHQSRQITDWEGTDSFPMWHGERVYYLSDAGPDHRLNIWMFDTKSGQRNQVTTFAGFDVRWPAIGPGPSGGGEIVFQNGSGLFLLDLTSGAVAPVEVLVPGDRPALRPQAKKADGQIFSAGISSTGKRAVLEARGDIWTLPAKQGPTRNLTRTSGIAERSPVWSPDGKSIAFFADKEDSYDLYLTHSEDGRDPRRLTHLHSGFLFNPVWSPDSKNIAFWDKAGTLFLHDLDAQSTKQIDRDETGSIGQVSWSPDSRWLAYGKTGQNLLQAVWIYSLAGGSLAGSSPSSGATHQVTSGMYNDYGLAFSRDGKLFYFISNRDFSTPLYEDLGTTWIYAQTSQVYVVPLRAGEGTALAPKSDEETIEEKTGGDAKDSATGEGSKADATSAKNSKTKDKSETEKEPEVQPVHIDFEGFERRAIKVPIQAGTLFNLNVNDQGQLIYIRADLSGDSDKSVLALFDLSDDDHEEKVILKGIDSYALAADGKKLLAIKGSKHAIIDAQPGQKLDDAIDTAAMTVEIDPVQEWRQMFHEAWRLYRDLFYDPTMHGVDWSAVRTQYAAMLDDCVTREDLSFVIREMISELNVGHAYYRTGDEEVGPSRSVGFLGVDFELAEGAYRIAKIYDGGAGDIDARGPLRQPGINAAEGDFLLAVNGVPVDAAKSPYAAFLGLANTAGTLTLSKKPVLDKDARRVTVEFLSSETNLRYLAWIESNRAEVDRKSGGKVGYIYVPSTGIAGQNDLFRQFFGQLDKQALIIDERWNTGGQIPTRFVELLNRPLVNFWALRDGGDVKWPQDGHSGPKCMLINGMAGSGGDYFPYWFRESGLGKLIGTRTWGGLVGFSGNPALIDGATTTIPTFAFYEKDGTWGIEGHGVDPDLVVIDDPTAMTQGEDPQLDAAIAHMLEELVKNPPLEPRRPPYPKRGGMGLPESDK